MDEQKIRIFTAECRLAGYGVRPMQGGFIVERCAKKPDTWIWLFRSGLGRWVVQGWTKHLVFEDLDEALDHVDRELKT